MHNQYYPRRCFSSLVLALLIFLVWALPLSAQTPPTLIGIDNTNHLVTIDIATLTEQTGTFISETGIRSLAYQSASDTLFGLKPDGQLLTIDRVTGAIQLLQILIPQSGAPYFSAMTVDEGSSPPRLLVANGGSDRRLMSVTLSGTPPYATASIGAIGGSAQVTGLAFQAGTLFAINRNRNALGILNPNNADFVSTFSNCGINNPDNIAFDPRTNSLYGVFSPNTLGLFDLNTGHAVGLGNTSSLTALAFTGAPTAPTPTATATPTIAATNTPTPVPSATPTIIPSPTTIVQPTPTDPGYFVAANIASVNVSSRHPYHLKPSGARVTKNRKEQIFTLRIRHKGAKYITPHFATFDLERGDKLILRSPNRQRLWTYDRYGPQDLGRSQDGFWGIPIVGDTAVIELHVKSKGRSYGFKIDRYAHGYSQRELEEGPSYKTSSTCSPDDRQYAKCYKNSEQLIYGRARTVVRLHTVGKGWATGFLFGSDGDILTNHHVISNALDAQNTSVEIIAEGNSCTTACNYSGACPGTIVAASTILIKTDAGLDYSLIKPVTSTNLTKAYGYLRARTTSAIPGERIYIPQHPLGWGKRIAVASSDFHDSSGFAQFDNFTPIVSGTPVVTPFLQYYADTNTGSSGAPVLSYQDHTVIGMHSRGGCPNSAVPINKIMQDLNVDLPKCARATDLNCPKNDQVLPQGIECGQCSNNNQCNFGAECVEHQCITVGSHSVGEQCCSNLQCKSGRCTDEGVCECNGDSDCDEGEVCRAGIGSNYCHSAKKDCEGCVFDFECLSRNCKGLRCVTSNSVGLAGECCRDSQCISGSCSAAKACQCKVNGDCPTGFYCDTGVLSLGANFCIALKESCDFCGADKQCPDGMRCDGKPFGRCITGNENRAVGSSCCRDDQCASGSCPADNSNCQCAKDGDCPSGQYCAKGFLGIGKNSCKSFRAECSGCTRDDQCGPGAECHNFACIKPHSRANGASCCRDRQCSSKKCKSGKCKS